MAKVVIFGAGRGADVAARYLSKDSEHEVCGFAVDDAFRTGDSFRGLPLVDFASVEARFPPERFHFFVPLGFQRLNRLRHEKYSLAKEKGYRFVSYVHSGIPFRDERQVGENCFILENNTLNFDVVIGDNVVLWSANQIGDQSRIGDHVWISSHVCISGNVTIEPFSFLGINATISNNVTVGAESFIGANALIAKDTAPKSVHVVEGTPKAAFPSDRFIRMVERSSS